MSLPLGSKAPDFTLARTGNQPFTLSKDQANKPCILYFYPISYTTGCTKEACSFRDHFEEFQQTGIEVYGITQDKMETLEKFKKQYSLPFELLCDERGIVGRKYQALVPLLNVTKRITYLLDANHNILQAHTDFFRATSHIDEMLNGIKKFNLRGNGAPAISHG